MKRLIILSIIALLCFSVLTTAHADVLWEPFDAYWFKNQDECTYLGHTYIINGPEGYVPVYSDPASTKPVLYLPNGGEFFIAAYTETGGRKMGVIQYKTTATGEIVHNWGENVDATYGGPDDFSITWTRKGSGTGWLDMNMVVKKYDNSSFEEEFGDQFIEGEFPYEPDLEAGTEVYLWAYPGAPATQGTLAIEADRSQGGNAPVFSMLYTDENGLEWGQIGYYYGRRNVWICISDPTNDSLPVREIAYDLVPASDNIPESSSGGIFDAGSPYLAVVLVALTVIITAVLIAFLYGKKRGISA